MNNVKHVILDEAGIIHSLIIFNMYILVFILLCCVVVFLDEMLNMGFADDVEKILAKVAQIAIQLQQILETEHVTKTQLANRMKTSRASLDRLLDAMNPSLTVASLGKAAAALGRKVELRFVPA